MLYYGGMMYGMWWYDIYLFVWYSWSYVVYGSMMFIWYVVYGGMMYGISCYGSLVHGSLYYGILVSMV